jgi:hypothetical protein
VDYCKFLLTAILFVAVVLAIVAVVALLPHVQALEPVGAAELVERTRDARRRFAPFLVPPVAAVEVAITAFGLWQAQPSARLVTAEVVRLAFAICCEIDNKAAILNLLHRRRKYLLFVEQNQHFKLRVIAQANETHSGLFNSRESISLHVIFCKHETALKSNA